MQWIIFVAVALPDYKELQMLSLQIDVFIGRRFERLTRKE